MSNTKERIKRISAIRENQNAAQKLNATIAQKTIDLNNLINDSEIELAARHSNNVTLCKDQKIREQILREAEERCYPPDQLEILREISNRIPFDSKSVTEEDIQLFLNADTFLHKEENIRKNSHVPGFLENIFFKGGGNK